MTEIFDPWKRIMSELNRGSIEMTLLPHDTDSKVWFMAYRGHDDLYVFNARRHEPTTTMEKRKTIEKKEFESISAYYFKWISGDEEAFKKARETSSHTDFIFGILKHFDIDLNQRV